MTTSVSARELYDHIRGGDVSVLDVRNRDEFEAWHVDGSDVTAAHVPYMEFVSAQVTGDTADLLPGAVSEPVVAVCAVGKSSGEVASSLRDAGVDAANLEGGMEAWANLVVSHDLGNVRKSRSDFRSPSESLCDSEDGVVQYERPSSGCLSYLVADGDEAAVVDPLAAAADRYAADASELGLEVEYAVDTHVHADHISGVRAVADATGAERVLPAGAAERGLDYDATLVGDGDALGVGDRKFVVEHAPGHTTELVVIGWGDDLLTADCLFLDGVGRPDLEAEDRARELAGRQYDTLHEVVFAHGDETRVLPGHVEATTPLGERGFARLLGEVWEKLGLADVERDAFVERLTTDLPPRPANYADIVAVNLGKREIGEETLELERGPNNCAVSSA